MRFLSAIALLLLLSTSAYGEHFIVIVNGGGPLAGEDMDTVRDVFLGEKRFAGKVRLLPVNYPEGELKESFLKEVVGMTPKEYKHHWIKKVFQEGSTMPATKGSGVEIIEYVAREKGAVAYIPATWSETIRSGLPGLSTPKVVSRKALEGVVIIEK